MTTTTQNIGQILQRYGIFIALAVMCLTLAVISENFLSTRNILNVLRQTSINGILAIGMTFVILTRGIDLSVGSVVAFAGLVVIGAMAMIMYELFSYIEKHTTAWAHRGTQGE